jgi:dihydroorotate dehydrogenase electron transfer subunit
MIRAVGRVVHADERTLALDVPGWPGQRPGQFAMLTLDPLGPSSDPLLPRPMAVFRAHGERVEFRHKVVGRGTALLSALPAGAPLGVVGPLGNGFPPLRGRALLVGGGTGIASLYGLAQREPGCRVLLGGRSQDDVLALADFEGLDVELEVATEDGSLGHRGLVTELLHPESGQVVCACGPGPMMRAASDKAAVGGARCLVSLENHMACGFGICLGCVVPARGGYRYVCTDGPVFDAAELDWEAVA